jgi:hypothetical protein
VLPYRDMASTQGQSSQAGAAPARRAEVCPECGYDLTGLELPYRCPECGTPVDPAGDNERAVAWFASWRGLLFAKAPPHAGRYLRDPRCRRPARKRLVRWLLLMLANAGAILAANGVVVVRDVWVTRFVPSSPERIVDEYAATRRDRIFDTNTHLFGAFGILGYSPPPGTAVIREKVLSCSIQYRWPDPDELARLGMLLPSSGVAVVLAAAVVLRLGGRQFEARTGVKPAVLPLLSPLIAVQVGYMALLVPFYVLLVSATLIWWPGLYWAGGALLAATACATVGSGAAVMRSLRACRPRQAGFSRLALMLAGLSIAAVQPVVVWFLVRIVP